MSRNQKCRLLVLCGALLMVSCGGIPSESSQGSFPINPYAGVDWAAFSHHRADLHVHTLQSDGCHLLAEVVTAYKEAGFSILSITDHDLIPPNVCPKRLRSSPTDSPYPDPQPPNFPANTTWPWSEFGSPSAEELGILGIEGVELSCGIHHNSFFIDYGLTQPCIPTLNEQSLEVARRGGLIFINHPEGRLKEWYIELFRNHAADYLVGMEISLGVDEATALWDQALAALMPSRPVWGFATSDMHLLSETPFAFTVFLLDELTMDGVKRAMQAGQFYSVVGPEVFDLRQVGRSAYDGTYPALRSIRVNRDAAEIVIDAANYDEIVWISGRSEWRYEIDPETGVRWPPSEVVQRGPVFDYAEMERSLSYVRAELIRHSDDGPIRLITSPFALAQP